MTRNEQIEKVAACATNVVSDVGLLLEIIAALQELMDKDTK